MHACIPALLTPSSTPNLRGHAQSSLLIHSIAGSVSLLEEQQILKTVSPGGPQEGNAGKGEVRGDGFKS